MLINQAWLFFLWKINVRFACYIIFASKIQTCLERDTWTTWFYQQVDCVLVTICWFILPSNYMVIENQSTDFMAMPQSQLSVIHATRRELWCNIHQKIDDPKHCLKLKLPLQNSYEAKLGLVMQREKFSLSVVVKRKWLYLV